MAAEHEILALESKFFGAFERGDSAAIAECYAPATRVWNNVLQREATGSEHISGLEAEFFPMYANRKFTDIRTDLFEGGFVRQHVFTGSYDSAPVKIPMCVICRIRSGKMERIDEYLTFAPPPVP